MAALGVVDEWKLVHVGVENSKTNQDKNDTVWITGLYSQSQDNSN